MSKSIQKPFYLFILILSSLTLHGQTSINAAGGKATGNNGSNSFSVGQVFFNTIYSNQGDFITQGVQQPFEISEILSNPYLSSLINLKIYPNPTSKLIYLEFNQLYSQKLNYRLVDLQGRLVKTGEVSSLKTEISMQPFSTATYFLQINDEGNTLKTFKIIKN